MLTRSQTARRALVPAALGALVLASLSACGGGCTPVEVSAEPAAAPAAGQPLVLRARATQDGEPVAGLGLRRETDYRSTGGTLRNVVTGLDGRAELRLPSGLEAVRPAPGDELLGSRAVFSQSDPGLDREGDVCSDESPIVSVG